SAAHGFRIATALAWACASAAGPGSLEDHVFIRVLAYKDLDCFLEISVLAMTHGREKRIAVVVQRHQLAVFDLEAIAKYLLGNIGGNRELLGDVLRPFKASSDNMVIQVSGKTAVLFGQRLFLISGGARCSFHGFACGLCGSVLNFLNLACGD